MRGNIEIDYNAIAKFKDLLKSIDRICGSDEFRVQQFGENASDKYTYQPLVGDPDTDEDAKTIENSIDHHI